MLHIERVIDTKMVNRQPNCGRGSHFVKYRGIISCAQRPFSSFHIIYPPGLNITFNKNG